MSRAPSALEPRRFVESRHWGASGIFFRAYAGDGGMFRSTWFALFAFMGFVAAARPRSRPRAGHRTRGGPPDRVRAAFSLGAASRWRVAARGSATACLGQPWAQLASGGQGEAERIEIHLQSAARWRILVLHSHRRSSGCRSALGRSAARAPRGGRHHRASLGIENGARAGGRDHGPLASGRPEPEARESHDRISARPQSTLGTRGDRTGNLAYETSPYRRSHLVAEGFDRRDRGASPDFRSGGQSGREPVANHGRGAAERRDWPCRTAERRRERRAFARR